MLVLAAVAVAGAGCRRSYQIGSLACTRPADCAPPDSVCGPDGRCVDGCLRDPGACVNGAACDPATGECAGALSCAGSDGDCDPPATVCSNATHTCVAGCTIAGCSLGLACDATTGRCCDPTSSSCHATPDAGPGCNGDSECPGAPATICQGGACVPGCAQSGCTAPLTCDATSGHCVTASCARDLDCDRGSYCTPGAQCAVLAFSGAVACQGGTPVSYSCGIKSTPAEFVACAGQPGPAGCPYCIDNSCFHPDVCSGDAQCHGGDRCTNGLCRVVAPECPTTVPFEQVADGDFAAGKEVCVRGVVASVRSGYDGMIEVRLGASPSTSLYLYADIMPMYAQAGVRVPQAGETVTVHGVVRWDGGHHDRELLPVDWVSP